jgi:hypothetical protein
MKSHNITIKATRGASNDETKRLRGVIKTKPEIKKAPKREMIVAPVKEDTREQSIASAAPIGRLNELRKEDKKKKDEKWNVNQSNIKTPYGKVKIRK